MRLTIALIIGAFLTLAYMLQKIRKSQIQTSDAIFWFVFAICLVVIAIFPQIAFFFSDLLGFQSPSNFVFLCVVAVLVLKEFMQTVEIARLKEKLASLAQNDALKK